MSKTACDIIRDLLPLYKDHVCSEKSKDLVEEHLQECENCREYLEAMEEDLPSIGISPNQTDSQGSRAFDAAVKNALDGDVKTFKKIAKRLSLMRLIPLCLFALIIVTIILSVISNNPVSYRNIPGFDRRVNTKEVQVTELYQLENGNLYFTLESDVSFQIPSYTSSFSPDALPEFIETGQKKVSFIKCSSFEKNILEKPSFNQWSFVVPIKEPDAESVIHETRSIYYEGKRNAQLAVWEKGQKIEAAPEKVEERVLQERKRQENNTAEYSDGYEVLPEYEGGILSFEY